MFTKFRIAIRSLCIGLCVFLLSVSGGAYAQDESAQGGGQAERVYKASEVDEKALIDHKAGVKDGPAMGECEGHGRVRLRAVLHSSGKVTDVRVIRKAECKDFEERAIRAAQKTRFKPARKGGMAVSQYAIFEYNYGTTSW